MKVFKEHGLFIFILVVCSLLRFIPLFNYQFTYDELSGLNRTQFSSFSEVMEKGVKIDAHPALVQLLIFYTVHLFGYVTWIVKLPFLLFSLGAVVYAYLLGLKNFSKQSGLMASLIFAFSLIFIFYAPIARMYISGVFFSMALLYYFFEIFFRENTKWTNYFFLGFFACLSALNQHINALFALTVCVSGLFFLNKQNSKAYLYTCTLTVVAYLPHLPVTLYQLSVPGIGRDIGGWLEAPEFMVIFCFLKTLMGTGKTYLVLLAIVALSLLLHRKFELSKKQLFLLIIFCLNYLIIYVYSIFRAPVFQYSVMLFSSTAIILFLCSYIQFSKTSFFYVAFLALFSVLIYKSYLKKDYLHQAVKTVFEYQFERTIYYKKLKGAKNVYPIFCDADQVMKKIYFEKYKTKFDCTLSADSMIADMEPVRYKIRSAAGTYIEVSPIRLFAEFVSNLNCDYLVLSSATPIFQAVAQEHFPFLIENTQTQGINLKVYSKRKEDRTKVVEDDKTYTYSSPNQPGVFDYSKINALALTGTNFLLKIDSLNEFPFDAKASLDVACNNEGQVIVVKTILSAKNPDSNFQSCLSLTDKNTNESYHYTAKTLHDFLPNNDSVYTMYSDLFNGTKFKDIRYKANINCYLWNTGKEKIELQDFEIKVIDYWQKKWHFWD